MKKITILLVMALLCLNICSKAQTKTNTNLSATKNNSLSFGEGWGGAFKIGTKLPDSILNANYNIINDPNGATTTTLRAYQGKLVILDFWASWCGSCLAAFPKLDSLQAKYKDRLTILLVGSVNTKDKPERMLQVLKGELTETKASHLGSIINDSQLMKMFPHQFLPHYVWIGAKGEVLAITPAEFVNETKIEQLLPNPIKVKP